MGVSGGGANNKPMRSLFFKPGALDLKAMLAASFVLSSVLFRFLRLFYWVSQKPTTYHKMEGGEEPPPPPHEPRTLTLVVFGFPQLPDF